MVQIAKARARTASRRCGGALVALALFWTRLAVPGLA